MVAYFENELLWDIKFLIIDDVSKLKFPPYSQLKVYHIHILFLLLASVGLPVKHERLLLQERQNYWALSHIFKVLKLFQKRWSSRDINFFMQEEVDQIRWIIKK